MSICTIFLQVLCNIYQIPLETVVSRLLTFCDEFIPGEPPEYFFDRNPDNFPAILNMFRFSCSAFSSTLAQSPAITSTLSQSPAPACTLPQSPAPDFTLPPSPAPASTFPRSPAPAFTLPQSPAPVFTLHQSPVPLRLLLQDQSFPPACHWLCPRSPEGPPVLGDRWVAAVSSTGR